MKKKPILMLALALTPCLPSLVHAGAYRCLQSNGSTAYQDHPCQKGSTGSAINLVPVQGYSGKDANASLGRSPPDQPASGTTRYPYAREGDVEHLKAENAELQSMNARMKAGNPDWQHSQPLTRLNAQAEALNKQIEGDSKPTR